MKRDLAALAGGSYDLAIVGGGIYGACAAREAALAGLRVCLVERNDFGSATSSQSLRIIHGGLRFLQHLDARRMREHVAERRTLMRIAPHLVEPLACVIPTYGHGLKGRELLEIALLLNDLVSFDRNRGMDPGHRIPRGGILSRAELLAACPGIPPEGISGGALWYDARARNTERLLFAFLESAVRAGAQVANHVEATGILRSGARVTGLSARDARSGATLEVRAGSVLNAAGPWVDQFLATLDEEDHAPHFRPSKGINLLVRRTLATHALGIPCGPRFRDADALVEKGARMLFFVPWNGRSLIGTKHLPHVGGPEALSVTPDELAGLLDEINDALPAARLTAKDVVAVLAGMLPEKDEAGGGVQLQKHPLIVDHARAGGPEGLITLVGVKWTTARKVAEDALGLVLSKLGRTARDGASATTPVAGGDIPDLARFLAEGQERRPRSISAASMDHLLRGRGTLAGSVVERVRRDPELGRPLTEASPVIGAELVEAAEQEMAEHLDDALLRRTELWLAAPLERGLLERCARIVAPVLGWDRARTLHEVERAQEALARMLPSSQQVG